MRGTGPHNCIPSSPCKICSRPYVKTAVPRHLNCIMPAARLQPKYSSECEKARAAAAARAEEIALKRGFTR